VKEKMTIIRVLGGADSVTKADVERWRQIFSEKRMTVEEAVATGEVLAEEYSKPESEDFDYMTIVKIGSSNYQPSFKDLETWRDLFADAKGDPDFKVFICEDIDIEITSIPIGKIIAVD
jgi:hypothetical protein